MPVFSPLSTSIRPTGQQSPRSAPANMAILHHGATTSLEAIIRMAQGAKQVSMHQGVKDGARVAVVDETQRAWSLSDAYWDSRAFTTECANESTSGWAISGPSHESLAQLVADWSRRYGWWPHRDGDPRTWTVIGHREVYTIHGGSYATACPGGMNLDWITVRAQQIRRGDTGNTPKPPTRAEKNKKETDMIYSFIRHPNGGIMMLNGETRKKTAMTSAEWAGYAAQGYVAAQVSAADFDATVAKFK